MLLTTIYVLAPYSDTTRIHHSELRHMPTEALLELSNYVGDLSKPDLPEEQVIGRVVLPTV